MANENLSFIKTFGAPEPVDRSLGDEIAFRVRVCHGQFPWRQRRLIQRKVDDLVTHDVGDPLSASPLQTALENMIKTADHTPVIDTENAVRSWKKRPDPLSFLVCEVK